MNRPWISVVVPAYNEEKGIAQAVAGIREGLEGTGQAYEILVVDNGSDDRTVEELRSLDSAGGLHILENEVNRGKGYSVRRGMLAARGELRLHCDADCAPSFESLDRLLEALAGADVAVGSRLAAGARLGRRQHVVRRAIGRTFVGLCRAVLREPTRDLFCGFKLWREDAAVATYSRTTLDGWVFDAESLAMARALGYRLREVGIHWTDREGSRVSIPRALVPVLRELTEARRHVRAEARRAHGAAGEANPPGAEAGESLVPKPADPRP